MTRFAFLPSSVLAVLAAVAGCSSDDTSTPASPSPAPSGSPEGGAASSADGIDEAALAACPQSSTLIQTTDWPSCLAGRRVAGTEPFNNQPCELRIGSNGAFEYLRSGVLALSVPEKSTWRSASGTYQNESSAGRRLFLAGISPDFPVAEAKPRVTTINLSFFSLAGQDDTVEVAYLDAALARQTYNCKVNVL